MSTLEPNGGNVYLAHRLMISSGEFWRCKHWNTGFKDGLEWEGCPVCALDNPEAFAEFERKPK